MKKTIYVFLPACLAMSLFATFARAQQRPALVLTVSQTEVAVGSALEVVVSFAASGQPINAVSGKVVVPAQQASVMEIRKAKSVVPLWVKEPTMQEVGGNQEIVFSAAGPAGLDGKLFSLIVTAKQLGKLTIQSGQGLALLSDGRGTQVPLPAAVTEVAVTLQAPVTAVEKQTDNVPPENFTTSLARDAGLFDNSWFIVFYAQDKDSGIDHYEVLETLNENNVERQSGWTKAGSPYVLKDQALKSKVYVKAIDKFGNVRLAQLSLPQPQPSENLGNLAKYVIISIILFAVLLAVGGLVLTRKLRNKPKNQV